jgi:hypothetical protein
MPRKAPITLKREIAALLASGNFGRLALVLDDKDVLFLLRAAIEQEGSIGAFAKRHGQQRTSLNNMLNGKRPVSASLVKALGFRRCTSLNKTTSKWQRRAASRRRAAIWRAIYETKAGSAISALAIPAIAHAGGR